jgi:hypothetical protein
MNVTRLPIDRRRCCIRIGNKATVDLANDIKWREWAISAYAEIATCVHIEVACSTRRERHNDCDYNCCKRECFFYLASKKSPKAIFHNMKNYDPIFY